MASAKKSIVKKAVSKKLVSKKPVLKKKVSKKTIQPPTCIVVNYDVGFNNKVTIRGQGAGLDWAHGKELMNVASNEWRFNIDEGFEDCEFKVLINDEIFELGDNHHVRCGQQLRYSPRFS